MVSAKKAGMRGGTLRSGELAKLAAASGQGNGEWKTDEEISIAINESVVDRVLKDRKSIIEVS